MADDIRLILGVDDRDLIRSQKEQKKFERNILTIEKAFRSNQITASRYTSELNKQAKQLSRLGGTYAKANSEVRSYASTVRKLTDDQLRLTMVQNQAGKSTNRFGMYAQQVGYQVGDFFVQVQSGTSALVAFGQQGTQLAGLLPGLAGAVVGVSLAVGTMLLRSYLQVKEAADGTAASMKAFEDSLKSARQESISMAKELFVLEEGFTGLSQATFEKAIEKKALALEKVQKELEDQVAFLRGGFDLTDPKEVKDFLEVIQAETDAVKDATEAKKAAEKEYLDFRLSQQALANRKSGGYLQEMIALFRQASLELTRMDKESIDERTSAINEGIKIFRAASKRMRDVEAVKTQKTLDSLFKNRTLYYSIRFSGDREVMSQSLKASGKIGMSYKELLAAGVSHENILAMGIKPPTSSGKGTKESPKEKLAKYLQGKQQELTLEKQLVGVFDEERQIQTELFNIKNKYAKVITPQQEKELENILRLTQAERERQEAVEEAKAQQKALADTIASSMDDAMTSMVDGTRSVKEAFKDMARDIIKHLFKVLVVQRAINALGGIMSGSSNSTISSIGGGLESYGSMDGGGYTGDAPRSGGLDGKGGFMMMMHPKETVVDHTKANSGGGGQNVVINQSFNFAANGDDSVKKLIAQAAPQIAQMTKSSLLNDRRRGGATKAAFG